ncbi:MAG: [FeFe] hydrogenase H-cluster radical SAM maturase HydE [Ruminococcus sp.]|nr:[FeFe] hydrogenase H-cluster radical SAM maturase HydE [Ruminococcus sp.]
MKEIIHKLYKYSEISDDELKMLIDSASDKDDELLRLLADDVRRRYYGRDVFLRGLIEISSYCKNNCLYCGIRCGNKNAERYRLSREDILSCCDYGYSLGLRTFVLQGGEDAFFNDEFLCPLISEIKQNYPECAVTLSLGERSIESYRKLKQAGADRYLLRHEAADEALYTKLHPESMLLENRKSCLFTLKKLGFQTGSGFMVGAPYQTSDNIVSDIRFLQKLNPEMIGIGPFIPHCSTPFKGFKQGDLALVLRLVSILRLIFPKALIPSTTALGTIHPYGREMGLKAGANVVMPNLSPADVRKKYMLYNDKICTDEEACENIAKLKKRIADAGYEVLGGRGDAVK